ncbi:phospholipase D family protein [Bradyrhizobium sp. ORS 375]|uniref:phospholipase D family protein n=1 Tax=Bradyrhizobium sp. (strain ORS 375) TaxID=566679 RepID=UPI0011120CAD|nr:phospholipase D family protein [Bradyrhizobium sp. ORS 375]
MEFLEGASLTTRIREILKDTSRADIAVAYWGTGALELLKINPNDRGVRIVCCLKGGKSDPDVIEQFKKRARQHDKLHAKVVWTPKSVVVSSANASSNGMPESEHESLGLIEAGIYSDNVDLVKKVGRWFERLYSDRSRKISSSDLAKAAAARKLAMLRSTRRKAKKKASENLSLLEYLRRISNSGIKPSASITIVRELNSAKEDRAARRYIKTQSQEIQRKLHIGPKQLDRLDWYTSWPNLPADTIMIDCHLIGSKMRVFGVVQTFHSTAGTPIEVDGSKQLYHFVLNRGQSGPNFRLTKTDKDAISACANKLWKLKKGDNGGRSVPLSLAAPVLLRYASQHS